VDAAGFVVGGANGAATALQGASGLGASVGGPLGQLSAVGGLSGAARGVAGLGLLAEARGTLVVCPVVAVIQWRQEIARFTATGALRVRMDAGADRGCVCL
jgi:hypothetical protein